MCSVEAVGFPPETEHAPSAHRVPDRRQECLRYLRVRYLSLLGICTTVSVQESHALEPREVFHVVK